MGIGVSAGFGPFRVGASASGRTIGKGLAGIILIPLLPAWWMVKYTVLLMWWTLIGFYLAMVYTGKGTAWLCRRGARAVAARRAAR